MAQRLVRTVAAACVLVGALGASACGSSPEPGGPPSAGPTTEVAGGNHYRVVDDLCAEADISALTAFLPVVDDVRPRLTGSGMYCDLRLSPSPDSLSRAYLAIQVMVFDGEFSRPGDAQEWFENTRAIHERSGTVTPLPGLGEDAYIARNPTVGVRVHTYDGDAHFLLGLRTFSDKPIPEEVEQALIESLRATMQALLAT